MFTVFCIWVELKSSILYTELRSAKFLYAGMSQGETTGFSKGKGMLNFEKEDNLERKLNLLLFIFM